MQVTTIDHFKNIGHGEKLSPNIWVQVQKELHLRALALSLHYMGWPLGLFLCKRRLIRLWPFVVKAYSSTVFNGQLFPSSTHAWLYSRCAIGGQATPVWSRPTALLILMWVSAAFIDSPPTHNSINQFNFPVGTDLFLSSNAWWNL